MNTTYLALQSNPTGKTQMVYGTGHTAQVILPEGMSTVCFYLSSLAAAKKVLREAGWLRGVGLGCTAGIAEQVTDVTRLRDGQVTRRTVWVVTYTHAADRSCCGPAR
jgi:hypothetical protein